MPTSRSRPDSDVPELVLRAVSFAARRHGRQMRKDRETPYIAHPMRVMFILSHVFGVEDAEVLAAGVLHDTIEDTTTDYDDVRKEFGDRVAMIVGALSKDKRLQEDRREADYFAALAKAPVEVKLCKLADTLDNMIDSGSLKDPSKTMAKAQHVINIFTPGFPEKWKHVLEIVKCRIKV